MCKCRPDYRRYQTRLQQSQPYCYEGTCRPSEKWVNFSKDCPWKILKELYVKKKTPLCQGTSVGEDSFLNSWQTGDFSKHFCSEENCAPYHFAKPTRPDPAIVCPCCGFFKSDGVWHAPGDPKVKG